MSLAVNSIADRGGSSSAGCCKVDGGLLSLFKGSSNKLTRTRLYQVPDLMRKAAAPRFYTQFLNNLLP